MKKALALLLCGVLIFAVGCSNGSNTSSQESNSTSQDSSMETLVSSIVENSSKEETTSKDTHTSSKQETASKDTSSKEPEVLNPLIITCYGDSVTEGMSVELDKKYPSVLATLLGKKYKVQNAGDGGEKTTAIMARQGSMKVYTKAEVKFQSGQTEVLIDQGTTRGLVAENGRFLSWNDPFGRDVPISEVTINGKSYKLQFRNFAWSKGGGPSTCDTYLVRTNATDEEIIPENSQVVFAIANTSKTNYADIYFMGFNGEYTDIDDLVSQYQKMIDYRKDDNYLVVIPFWEKSIKKTAYEKFKKAFGDHAVDVVEYCVNGGLDKLGITLEKYDSGCLESEILPYSLKLYTISNRQDVHLNEKGYKVQQMLFTNREKRLNFGNKKEID